MPLKFKVRNSFKRLSQKIGAIAIICILILTIILLPVPIPANLDFSVLYFINRGLLNGIPIYDHLAQLNINANISGVDVSHLTLVPFPYPPWYSLITLPLGLFSANISARIWFAVNLLMIFTTTWLMLNNWPRIKRYIFIILNLLFVPVIGILSVGQYDFPVLLGAAMLIYALNKERPFVTAIALSLLTFKPHLGVLLIFSVIIFLLRLKNSYSCRALKFSILVGLFLFLIGFLADPIWPVNYIKSLLSYNQISEVSSCGICTSFPVTMIRLIGGDSNSSLTLLISILILSGFIFWLITKQTQYISNPDNIVCLFVIITLFSSPYLLNYDFVLLIIPLLVLSKGMLHPGDWLFILIIYCIPTLTISLWGRDGNFGLLISCVILFFFFLRKTKNMDVGVDQKKELQLHNIEKV